MKKYFLGIRSFRLKKSFSKLKFFLGVLFALIIASFALFADFNWRLAFWIGAVIAVIGVFARTRLRETPDFADYKRRMKLKEELSESKIYTSSKKVKYDKKAVIAMCLSMHATDLLMHVFACRTYLQVFQYTRT